jgi:hypothetical protein
MIKYTITPTDFIKGQLYVQLEPFDSDVSTLTTVIDLSKDELQELLSLEDIASQKDFVRVRIIRHNDGFQELWEQERASRDSEIPEALLDLLGVPGTTVVTQELVNAAKVTFMGEAPVIV